MLKKTFFESICTRQKARSFFYLLKMICNLFHPILRCVCNSHRTPDRAHRANDFSWPDRSRPRMGQFVSMNKGGYTKKRYPPSQHITHKPAKRR